MDENNDKPIPMDCKLNVGFDMTDKIMGQMSEQGADKASMALRQGVAFMFRCVGIGLALLLLCFGISLILWRLPELIAVLGR